MSIEKRTYEDETAEKRRDEDFGAGPTKMLANLAVEW